MDNLIVLLSENPFDPIILMLILLAILLLVFSVAFLLRG